MKAITHIEQSLAASLALGEAPDCPPKLASAVRHAVFPGGARIRPQLCLAVAGACGNDDPLLADYAEAQFIVRVAVTHVFPNCPRYIHKYQRVERSTFVPRAGCETPVPNWKMNDWAADVLPENDPARSR